MNNIIEIQGKEIEIYHTTCQNSGSGQKRISVTLICESDDKKFSAVTNDMPKYDEIQDIEDYIDRQRAYYDMIEYQIKDEVDEWVLELIENEE